MCSVFSEVRKVDQSIKMFYAVYVDASIIDQFQEM